MDWEAIRKLRASRIFEQQSFRLHKPLARKASSHRAEDALRNITATDDAVDESGDQFKRSGLSGKD